MELQFNPTKLNTDDWIKAAKEMGARYAILVAKHTSGFALWPTKAYGYNVSNTPWKDGKGDIVKDFIASCKKYGILPGIYCSYAANAYFNVDGGKVLKGSPSDLAKYNEVYKTMVSELWGGEKYGDGKLFEIWFDGGIPEVASGGPDLAPLVNKYINPATNVFNGPVYARNIVRWVGNEAGKAPYPFYIPANLKVNAHGYYLPVNYHGDPKGTSWVPGESDFPLRQDDTWVQSGWFWNAKNQRVLSVEELLKKYDNTVGSNTNMLVGIVIDTAGTIPEQDRAVMKAFGKAIQRFDHPLAKAAGEGPMLQIKFSRPRTVSTVEIQEDIRYGQRVQSYEIEGLISGKWQKLSEGSSIGHKRIERFDPVTVSGVRLRIKGQTAIAIIKNFSVFAD
jgi:alpha-L-fucosidase